MTGVLLAAVSALLYGSGDYCGGRLSRRVPAWTVTVVTQSVGLAAMVLLVPFVGGDGPTVRALGFGALGGLAGAAGLILMYHAMAHGPMSVVSPVTAVVGAAVPFVFGVVALGQRPGLAPLVGVVCALVAVGLVGASGRTVGARTALPIVWWAVLGGAGFGAFYVLLDRVSTGAGLWPLVAARAASLALALAVARHQRDPLVVPAGARSLAVVAGLCDIAANGLFLLATAHGQVAIVAVVASLYPASTVALARVVDRERLHVVQGAGLAVALVALVLIAL